MPNQWLKLGIDLTLNWWNQNKKSVGFWVSLILLVIPIAFFVHLYSINVAYNTPSFLGVDKVNNLKQIRYEDSVSAPIPMYLAEEPVPGLSYNIIYERATWLSVGKTIIKETFVSFFSGGYKGIGITPLIGSLDNLNYRNAEGQLHVAITHHFWLTHFKKQPVIGTTITLNDTVAVIDAVMRPEFSAFRHNQQIDLIVPFSFMPKLTSIQLDDLPPDVLSYINYSQNFLDDDVVRINQHYKDQLLMFEDEHLKVSDAIGMSAKEYGEIQLRLNRLAQLFSVLLLFSLIAFLSHQINNNESRQNEAKLRQMVGANQRHLSFQQLIENILTFGLLTLLLATIMPLTKHLIVSSVPNIRLSESTDWHILMITFVIVLVTLITLSSLSFNLQRRYLDTNLGRGGSASKGQKIQTFLVLGTMITLSCLSVIKGTELLQKQYQYFQKVRGYDPSNLYAVTFKSPKYGGTFYSNNQPELLIENLMQQQGIVAAAITNMPFMTGQTSYENLFTTSLEPVGAGQNGVLLSAYITPNYFNVAGISLIKGESVSWRRFNDLVISESLYKSFFNGQPLSSIKLIRKSTDGTKHLQNIVGIASDVYFGSLDDKPAMMVYRVLPTLTGFESLLIRSEVPQNDIIMSVEAGLARVDNTFDDPKLIDISRAITAQEAPQLALLSMSLVVMLILGATTVLFCVNSIQLLLTKSKREIALRLNIGARPHNIVIAELIQYLLTVLPIVMVLIGAIFSLLPSLFSDSRQAIFLFSISFIIATSCFALLFYVGVSRINRNAWASLT